MHTHQGDLQAAPEGDEVSADVARLPHVGGGAATSPGAGPSADKGTYGVERPARSTSRGRRILWPTVISVAALALGLVAFAALDGWPPASAPADPLDSGRRTAPAPEVGEEEQQTGGDPFEGRTLFVDPDVSARRQAEAWRSTRPVDAGIMARLAAVPAATWFTGNGDVEAAVDRLVTAAAAEEALPVLVAYNIPQRDCGQFSSGGASSPEEYRRWIADFATGVGNRPAVVVLEPDGLAQLSCLSTGDQMTRLALLTEAVAALEDQPGIAVYIDAGNPGWIPVDEMADLLRRAGITRAQGFALNVSNHHATDVSVQFARELSARVGGKGAVVDTSRNGAGSNGEWCNPEGRALGPAPTTETGDPAVDAFLWVKTPGESDGTCNGGPSAGSWWPEYALDLAVRAGL